MPRRRSVRRKDTSQRAQHYWLCDDCASAFTLAYAGSAGLIAVPLPVPEKNRIGSHIVPGSEFGVEFKKIPAGSN